VGTCQNSTSGVRCEVGQGKRAQLPEVIVLDLAACGMTLVPVERDTPIGHSPVRRSKSRRAVGRQPWLPRGRASSREFGTEKNGSTVHPPVALEHGGVQPGERRSESSAAPENHAQNARNGLWVDGGEGRADERSSTPGRGWPVGWGRMGRGVELQPAAPYGVTVELSCVSEPDCSAASRWKPEGRPGDSGLMRGARPMSPRRDSGTLPGGRGASRPQTEGEGRRWHGGAKCVFLVSSSISQELDPG
jgi:hypothetical protein